MSAEWIDAARQNREVPVKIHLPEKITGKAPIVIFSHGLGGSRDGYGYIGMHLASHGYVVVHVQHRGSDGEVLLKAMRSGERLQQVLRGAAMDPENIINRPADVSFAIDQLTKLNEAGELKGKLDLDRIAVAGHSFGGYTTMAIAGETFMGGKKTFRDGRVKAAIAMSPPADRVRKEQYQAITIPVMAMTGTKDDSPVTDTKAEQRLGIYEALTSAPRYMLVLDGGDHMVFSGVRRPFVAMMPGRKGDSANDPKFLADVKALSLAFFDAYLKGDGAARQWLDSEQGAKGMLGKDAAQWVHAVPAR
jgi:predicted dienelactone hydrolase